MNITVLAQLTPMFALILLGFLLGRHVGVDNRGPTALVLYVAVPSLLVHQVNLEADLPWFLLPAIGLTMASVIFGSFLVLRLLAPAIQEPGVAWRDGTVRPMTPAVMFMSYAYVGIPFAEAVGGEAGLRVGILIYLCGALLTYTVGVYLLSGGISLTPIFRLPLVYALACGLLLRLARERYHLTLPEVVTEAVASMAAMASPLILLSVGLQLSAAQLRHLRLGLGGALMRICLGGLLGLASTELILIATDLPLTPLASRLLCMVALLPSAAINTVFAHHFAHRTDIVDAVVVSSYVVFGFFGSTLVAMLFE